MTSQTHWHWVYSSASEVLKRSSETRPHTEGEIPAVLPRATRAAGGMVEGEFPARYMRCVCHQTAVGEVRGREKGRNSGPGKKKQ